MTKPLSVGVAGLGTVGAGVLALLRDNAVTIGDRAGRPIAVTAVSARDRRRDRGIPLDGLRWYDDPVALARDPVVDVVVELIGGTEGPALALAEAALESGRPLVTANKALLARHGDRLAARAEERGVPILFEAAVAGGIPAIKALREGLAGNRIARVAGILNGTCNFILTKMRDESREFAEVLAEAQRLGYAEADPSFDVDGTDTAHKLAILATLAFRTPLFQPVHVEGIRGISALDIQLADELGYRIKLLGIAQSTTETGLDLRVHPCMVPAISPLARTDGVLNAVIVDADPVGRVVLQGRGAGAGPTASAVVADLIDLARGRVTPAFGMPVGLLWTAIPRRMERHVGAYYLRLMVVDRPGVIADVTAILRDAGVSLESMLQRGRSPGEAVPVVLTTHDTTEAAMREAIARIAALDAVLEPPALIRIETQ